jgi:hypothetical protein
MGLLDAQSLPTVHELVCLPGFDTVLTTDLGMISSYGVDELGNRIFTVSLGPRRHIARAALHTLLQERIPESEDYILVDCLRCIHWTTRIGGFLSRQLGLIAVGRPLAAFGLKKNFACFVAMVREVRSLLRASS